MARGGKKVVHVAVRILTEEQSARHALPWLMGYSSQLNSMQHFETLTQGLRTATLQQILQKQSRLAELVLGTSGSHASTLACASQLHQFPSHP